MFRPETPVGGTAIINNQIITFLVILMLAMVFFSIEIVPLDVVALGLLIALILTGLLPPEQAFAGFGSETFIFILGLLILTAALLRTGVVEKVSRSILRLTGDNSHRLLVVILLAVSVLSSFMSNTASTAFFLPIVIGLAARARISPSRLLLPLAFASILAGTVTLVGTSTNIIVSALMTQYHMPPMGMFELTPVGLPILIVGLLYMLFIGRRLIPDRTHLVPTIDLTEEFGLRPYLTEAVVLPNSSLIGKTLADSKLGQELDLTVLRLMRGKDDYLAPDAHIVLDEGDVLLVEGARDAILKIKDTAGIDIKADVKFSDPDLQTHEVGLVEAILLPRSPLISRTLKGRRFRERYDLQVLAINRGGETILTKISELPLKMGDILLIQGARSNISLLQEDKTFHVIGIVENKRPNLKRAPIAVVISVGVLVMVAFNLLPISVAMLLGAVLAFLTRCITPEEAYREVEWRALILIGCMLALGAAMEHTGTASFLAMKIVDLGGHVQPIWLLSAFFLITVLLTQPMSNQAAAVVVLPIAIRTALQLGLNPRSFAMMVALAASCSFLTPLEPSCVMVFGPGHYRFVDFLKVGFLLTVLIYFIAITLVPMLWPL